MALSVSDTTVCHREVLLKDKPAAMLQASPKGTVPVLVLSDGRVIDESIAVMRWALEQRDPEGWLQGSDVDTRVLIEQNDGPFKQWLDRYKYHVRHPGASQQDYREQAGQILQQWEARIVDHGGHLTDSGPRLADVALFPFVRQFAGVEPKWWATRPYPGLSAWLEFWVNLPRFSAIMRKFKPWDANQDPVVWSLGDSPVDSGR